MLILKLWPVWDIFVIKPIFKNNLKYPKSMWHINMHTNHMLGGEGV